MPESVRIAWFAAWVDRLARRQMRRRFHGVFVDGADRARGAAAGRPLIACANHTNFWDGFVALAIGRSLCRRATWVLQEERHLARYPFFRAAGSIGIDLSTPVSALGGLRAALTVLRDPGALVWVFPQGRIEHPCEPVRIRPGACRLSARAGAPMLPMAFAYEWVAENRPGIYIAIGEPLEPGADETALQAAIESARDTIRARVAARDFAGLEAVIPLRRSLQRRWDAFWHHALRKPGRFEWRTP